ncbi:MAG: hypothetical protein R6U96_11880 [Promethearchaeia archaeon]
MSNEYAFLIKEREKELTDFLRSKGKIKAALLYKIEKKISIIKNDSKSLIKFIFTLLKEDKIDIIIPKLLKRTYEKKRINFSKYLIDGTYIISNYQPIDLRENTNLPDEPQNTFFLDSRNMDRDSFKTQNFCNFLIELIKNHPLIKRRIIILLRTINSSKKYKSLGLSNKLNNSIHGLKSREENIRKIKLSLAKQKEIIENIKRYRNKNMCFYIPLIEALHKRIIEIKQKYYLKSEENRQKLKKLTELFAYYCLKFVFSEWVEIQKPNPYKWETFFKKFDLPIKIIKLDFKSLKFSGKTFESEVLITFLVYINSEKTNLIQVLKNYGYKIFNNFTGSTKTAIGAELSIYMPCPSIEYFFFIFKYICYYNLFLLYHHCFPYFNKLNREIRTNKKEKNFYKLFFPVLQPLFNLKKQEMNKNLNFKFNTLNPDVLEVIFNKYLISQIKNIELPLFRYFLMRFQEISKNDSHNLPTESE